MALSEHLEYLTRHYWESWRTLKVDQGWTLGSDNGSAKMSPYLVHSFDGLDEDGKQEFRSRVALVLHAIDAIGGEPDTKQDLDSQKAVVKLRSALKAMDKEDLGTAKRKARTALRLLNGDPIRPKP
jgi:hypothetical protein